MELREVKDQIAALQYLAYMTRESILDPDVLHAARAITQDCRPYDDAAELHALYSAIKTGDSRVRGLERGVRYVADPVIADGFMTAGRSLKNCASGSCAGDCDDQGSLVGAMAGAIGFHVLLRAWGEEEGNLSHVYPCAAFPKVNPTVWKALDTTVPEGLGSEPKHGFKVDAMVTATVDPTNPSRQRLR
jgi:hypothetical protein